jgi:hypothetical protein
MEDDPLEIELDQRMEAALDGDDVTPVLKCLESAAVSGPARDLIDGGEAEPDGELEAQIPPAAWQEASCASEHHGSLISAAVTRHHPPM